MITNAMMCVGKPSSPIDSTCNGDSGSSVIYKNGDNYDSIGVVCVNTNVPNNCLGMILGLLGHRRLSGGGTLSHG